MYLSFKRHLLAIAIVVITLSVVPSLAFSQSPKVKTSHVQAELVIHAPDGLKPGKDLWLGLFMRHVPGWHTYWKNPGDSGLATTLSWKLPAGTTAGPILWPTPQQFPVGPLMNYGYADEVLLPSRLTLPSSYGGTPLAIQLRANWLVCRELCVPESGDFELLIPANQPSTSHARYFDAAFASAPVTHIGKASAHVAPGALVVKVAGLPPALHGTIPKFFSENEGVVQYAAAPESAWNGDELVLRVPLDVQRSASPASMQAVLVFTGQPAGFRIEYDVAGGWSKPATKPTLTGEDSQLSVAPATSFWLGALLAFGGGVLLNLMPCVFPILSMKVLGFAQHSGARKAAALSGAAYAAGIVVSFVGLAAILVALRSSGEQLGWGFQLQSPTFIAVLSALFTLVGLNLAGVFEVATMVPQSLAAYRARNPVVDDVLSGVLAVAVASPCTAPLMGVAIGATLTLPAPLALATFAALGLGMAAPYVVACLSPALVRRLPRPGPWMGRLKTAMAFPMFGTVVWLLWVLGEQVSNDAVAQVMVLLLVLSFGVWLMSVPTVQRRTAMLLKCFAVSLTAIVVTWAWPGLQVRSVSDQQAHAIQNEGIWQAWSPSAVEHARLAGTPVFVDFTAAWCITCQFNKRITLTDAEVLSAFKAKKVLLMRADWTRRDERITRELASLGRNGVPVYALYRPTVHNPQILPELLNKTIVLDALKPL
jgi:thiol:disulfide interchange protein